MLATASDTAVTSPMAAACDALHAACDALRAACDALHASCDALHAACDALHAACDALHAACDALRAIRCVLRAMLYTLQSVRSMRCIIGRHASIIHTCAVNDGASCDINCLLAAPTHPVERELHRELRPRLPGMLWVID